MALTDGQIERYSRQIIVPRLGGRGQERILASSLTIAGDMRDIEAPVAYLVGAGVGTIDLVIPGDSREAESLIVEMRNLNSDARVRIGSAPGAAKVDVGFAIIGSASARVAAEQLAQRRDIRASVAVRLDARLCVAVLPTRSPCLRCADARLLAKVGERAPSADFVAMLAVAEVFKLLAGYNQNPSPTVIEFDGYQTRLRTATTSDGCFCTTVAA